MWTLSNKPKYNEVDFLNVVFIKVLAQYFIQYLQYLFIIRSLYKYNDCEILIIYLCIQCCCFTTIKAMSSFLLHNFIKCTLLLWTIINHISWLLRSNSNTSIIIQFELNWRKRVKHLISWYLDKFQSGSLYTTAHDKYFEQ